MAVEMVVGLNVYSDKVYNLYRASISPLLIKYEGGFRYDFKINETLISEESKEINRLFLIFFKNKNLLNSFFSDSEYLKIKEEFFTKAVSSTTIITEYERP